MNKKELDIELDKIHESSDGSGMFIQKIRR
jgi:hypothetical protein